MAGFCEDTGSLLLQQVFADGRPSRIEKASGALLRRLGPSPPESLPPEIVAAAAAALESPLPFGSLRVLRHPRVPTIPVLYNDNRYQNPGFDFPWLGGIGIEYQV